MSLPGEVVLEGTLKPDGTLELDRKPGLAPGRVKVILQPVSELPKTPEGWWPYLQRVRAEREAARYAFLNESEMEGHLLWLRDDEEHIDRVYRELDEARRKQEGP